MIALIDEFKKELTDIAVYAPSTVDNYVTCMTAFFDYARRRLRIDPVFAKGKHILDWIGQVKKSGVSKSRLEHHRSALKLFFTLMVKLGIVVKNPADKLPQIRRIRTSERNRPAAQAIIFKLLASINRSGWQEIPRSFDHGYVVGIGTQSQRIDRIESQTLRARP